MNRELPTTNRLSPYILCPYDERPTTYTCRPSLLQLQTASATGRILAGAGAFLAVALLDDLQLEAAVLADVDLTKLHVGAVHDVHLPDRV